MILEIVSPEATLFKGEVESVSVPGVEGAFQMLNNHAPIVSALKFGTVVIKGNMDIAPSYASLFEKVDGATHLEITSGTVEMNNNKIILLTD
jgi:F-type H+-transporting ATPase subunit epsilon